MYDCLHRLLRVCAVFGALAGVSGLARAQVGQTGPVVTAATNGASVAYQGTATTSPLQSLLQGRSITSTGGGNALLTDLLSKPANIPGLTSVQASTPLTAGELAAAAVTLASRVNPVIKAGTIAALLLKDLRAKSDGAGGMVQDLGQLPVQKSVTQYMPLRNGSPLANQWFDLGGAMNYAVAFYENSGGYSQPNGNSNHLTLGAMVGSNQFWISSTQCNNVVEPGPAGPVTRLYCSSTPNSILIDLLSQVNVVDSCPAYNDPLNPANNIPEGGSPGPDGKCYTGKYVPTPADNLKTAFENMLKFGLEPVPLVATQILNEGGTISASSPTSLSGPASAIGTPQTVTATNSDGSISSSVQTPTYNYSYSGNTVTYTTTNSTTNTTTNNNTTTTTTTTKTGPDYTDPCISNPTRAGCSTIGDIPDDKFPVPEAVPFVIDSIALANGAGCPAPVTFTVPHLGEYQITYQPLCDFLASWMAALVNVMAVVYAAKAFMGGLRT